MAEADTGLAAFERALAHAIEAGLPLVPRPYAAIAAGLGVGENEVIAALKRMLDSGCIKRLGVVVRHHELGYRANAMVVWDVPDEDVDALGCRFAAHAFVTLCYRRPRRLPAWPYNLFTMIHGRDRAEVERRVRELDEASGGIPSAHEVLFSLRRFKQRGARYSPAPVANPRTAGGIAAAAGVPELP